jgi:Leucine Rich repeat
MESESDSEDEIRIRERDALNKALQAIRTGETALYLKHECIRDDGAAALARVLKTNNTLTELNLARNHITNDGARALFSALEVNATLTILNLNCNDIGDQGCMILANALKVNTTLTSLNLYYNQIGDDGTAALANALQVNKTLTRLNLTSNNIGDRGIWALIDAIQVNRTLTYLSIYRYGFKNVAVRALAEALLVNTTLTNITLCTDQFDSHDKMALAVVYVFTQRKRDHFDHNSPIWWLATQRVNKVSRVLNALAMALRGGRPKNESGDLSVFPKDMYYPLKKAIISTIFDDAWDREPEPQSKRLALTKAACIGCSAQDPQWTEEGNRGKAYCGSYCQMLHYTGLPDFRGMDPERLESVFSQFFNT